MRNRILYSSLGVASCCTAVFGTFNWQPQIVKVCTGGFLFLVSMILMLQIRRVKNNETRFFLSFLSIYVFIQICRCVIYPTEVQFTTYIFSPYHVFFSCLPLFICIADDQKLIHNIVVVALISSLLSIATLRAIGISFVVVALFWPYIRKKYILLLIFLLSTIIDLGYGLGVLVEDSARSYLLEIVLMIGVWGMTWKLKSRKISVIASILCIIIPFVIVISIFMMGASLLGNIQDYSDKAEFIGSDTRTFLYIEVIDSMNSLTDWLFGLGFNARYFSEFFLNSTNELADYYMRSNVEVVSLELLLKGGLVLVFVHYYLLLEALKKSIKKSNNIFCLGCGMYIAGYIALSFIVDYPSRNSIVQIMPWICAGICMSDKWLNMSDKEIERLLLYKNN